MTALLFHLKDEMLAQEVREWAAFEDADESEP